MFTSQRPRQIQYWVCSEREIRPLSLKAGTAISDWEILTTGSRDPKRTCLEASLLSPRPEILRVCIWGMNITGWMFSAYFIKKKSHCTMKVRIMTLRYDLNDNEKCLKWHLRCTCHHLWSEICAALADAIKMIAEENSGQYSLVTGRRSQAWAPTNRPRSWTESPESLEKHDSTQTSPESWRVRQPLVQHLPWAG